MKNQLYVSVSVCAKELEEAFVSASDHEQASNFIAAIDLAIADAGFTEDLILRLAKSLAVDFTHEEWADLSKKFAALG